MALRSQPSPQLSNRPSPPTTRSVSRRNFEHSSLNAPISSSTPLSRRQSLASQKIVESPERFFEEADDSYPEPDPNSSQFNYSDHFSPKEIRSMKKKIWSDWFEFHKKDMARRFIPSLRVFWNILQTVVLFSIFCHYCQSNYREYYAQKEAITISEVEQKFHQAISNFKTEYSEKEKHVLWRLENVESQMEAEKGWKDSVIRELSALNLIQKELQEAMFQMKTELEEERNKIQSSKVISVEPEKNVEPAQFSNAVASHHQSIHQNSLFRKPLPGINVANSLIGAVIEESSSSRTASAKDGLLYDIMSYFVSFQAEYVLLDRDTLSPGDAWCTYDKHPTLTVRLGRHINPRAVSYQHVRWNGIVPDHAPKLYDVVACRSACCTESEPLVTGCEYKAASENNGYELDEQEQFCEVPPAMQYAPIKYVQFRFRENHGNMQKTCAYLVRVYGHKVDVTQPPVQKTSGKNHSNQVDSMSHAT